MNIVFSLLALAGFLLTLVLPTTAVAILDARSDIYSLYPRTPIHYAGTIGGYDVALNGSSVEDILAQMSKLYPEFDHAALAARALDDNALNSGAVLDPRSQVGLICYAQDWAYTWDFYVILGVAILRKIGGSFDLSPRSCAFASCQKENNCAIEVCNDNDSEYYVNLNEVADYALYISTHCTIDGITTGQLFDSANYNVIVRKTGC